MDIETATDILTESHTCIAKAKSCSLTHTLICEALQAGKCWNEIKGSLRLKLLMQISILTDHTLWRYNIRIKKLLLPMFTASKQQLSDVPLTVTLWQSTFLRDFGICTPLQLRFTKRILKLCLKSSDWLKNSMHHSNQQPC